MQIDIHKIKKDFLNIAKEQGIHLALLFGSQASGKTHKESDIDIAIMRESKLSPNEIAQLSFVISERLHIGNLELADLRQATPLLLKEIAHNSLLLYEKEKGFCDEFCIYAVKRYIEARPLLKLREASLKAFLQNI